MKFYQIEETLIPSDMDHTLNSSHQFVAILDNAEWKANESRFQMGIDLDLNLQHPNMTQAEINYDSVTGSFSIPDREDLDSDNYVFSFAFDEKGIVFIDDGQDAEYFVERIRAKRKWKFPSLERFLYDFLECIAEPDLVMLEAYEQRISEIEDQILAGTNEHVMKDISGIRDDLLKLRTHYEQLLDIGQEFNEDENGFFHKENLRYFDMFCARIMRLQDYVTTLREFTVQVRDMYQAQLDVKQNRIMTVLTVVTVIFMPLTLIAGWYGMNFKYMPEFDWVYSYPIVILVCLIIVIVSLIFFKKKKWL